MSQSGLRCSPIHHRFETQTADWILVGDMLIPRRLHGEEDEKAATDVLGLFDISGLTKLGVKGRDSESWLLEQNVDIPAANYESRRLADGGIVVRLAADEFVLESGISNHDVPALSARLASTTGHVFCMERQEATFLLVGSSAPVVLSQTCGIDFRTQAARSLVLTRVAGVSCGVFLDNVNNARAFRFWIDYSYAEYLWEILASICEELGGHAMGAGRILRELP